MSKKFLTMFVRLLIILCFCPFLFAQEQVTITTYFPAPFGVYNQLRTNMLAVGNATLMPTTDGTVAWGGAVSRGQLRPDNGASIELGGSGTPYIDFSNDNGAGDFDQRIVSINDSDLNIQVSDRVEIKSKDNTGWRDVEIRDLYLCNP
jgi:hypothetical protein